MLHVVIRQVCLVLGVGMVIAALRLVGVVVLPITAVMDVRRNLVLVIRAMMTKG